MNTPPHVADPVVLAPCARVGGPGDWWREQHVSCTKSHHVSDPVLGIVEFPCACECHAPKKEAPP